MIDQTLNLGLWSLLPLTVALVMAFKTRSAIFSLFTGALFGALMLSVVSSSHSKHPFINLSQLIQSALGNADFLWICLMVCLIGVMFELFKHAGVLAAFTKRVSPRANSHKSVGLTAWLLGIAIIDDYFSPLMSGAIMRPLSDKVKMSREKLAFILDSTTASVCILMPFMAWGTMMTGLIKAQAGPVSSIEQAFGVFVYAIPYNFYAIILLLFSLGIVLKVIPDFGPMKRAESRALEKGLVMRKTAMPLVQDEPLDLNAIHQQGVNLISEFIMPISILFGSILSSLVLFGSVMIVESFMLAVTVQMLIMFIKKRVADIDELIVVIIKGIKAIVPTLLIIALAYVINTVTKELGAAQYIADLTKDFLSPSLLVVMSFIFTAVFSFATGTSWGAYALMMPLAVPAVYAINGAVVDDLLLQTVAAVAGGGIFGDHASPVSDTTVLSSAGAGSDHMDHVVTQLPYASLVAVMTVVIYFVI